MKKTKFFNKEERKWVLIDAKDKVLGRLAVRIAMILMGKTKATYSPNFLCGDQVVVINVKDIVVTGNKESDKIYDKYTGFQSGRKEITYKELKEKNPSKILYYAVKGMLPKNWLGKRMIRSLKIYPDNQHAHQAQQPQTIEVLNG
ncbi:MAG: 50S ribosomal protein L13 [Candidatus Omnitrophica bacterium]|nr:50S ribosomal protein L13 [Candidatus Omnitrophota bacterium]